MGDDPRRIVWILGAGFSAGVGGPPLTRLLTRASEGEVEARYPRSEYPALHSEEAADLRAIYEYGSTDGEIPLPPSRSISTLLIQDIKRAVERGKLRAERVRGEKLWGNAEEFLDYVDTAAETRASGAPNPHAAQLTRILRRVRSRNCSPSALRDVARRLIAAECCAFLEGADLAMERWKPFRSWARGLSESDTIISFNYDRVVERLRDFQNAENKEFVEPGSGAPRSRIETVLPGDAERLDPESFEDRACLLKLHGSVDWRRRQDGEQVVIEVAGERSALTCRPEELAVATPGPSKLREVERYRDLWKGAKAALRQAHAIVFLGYRFPETDAEARWQLLEAISENRGAGGGGSLLPLHIVLGNFRDGAPERLAALLRFAASRYRREYRTGEGYGEHLFEIRQHPLLVQDFFSVSRRDNLF